MREEQVRQKEMGRIGDERGMEWKEEDGLR